MVGDKGKSYPRQKSPKNRKKRVIHQVIHVIHRKNDLKSGLHSKKNEYMFCEEIIKNLNAYNFKSTSNVRLFEKDAR